MTTALKAIGTLAAVLGIASCGTAAPSQGNLSPSGSATPGAISAAALPSDVSCQATFAPSPLLGLVGRSAGSGSPSAIVYDVYDLREGMPPRLLCSLSGASRAHFLSATEIAYARTIGGPSASTSSLIRLDLVTHHIQTVASGRQSIGEFSWSSDKSVVAYGWRDQVFIRHGNSAPIAVAVPQMTHLGVDFAGYNYQEALRVSSDGRYLAVVETAFGRLQVFDTATGAMIWGAPPGTVLDIRTMAIWSHAGHRLYWRDNAGVHGWDPPTAVTTRVPGLIWYDPSLSPDGGTVAYTVRDAQTFVPHVELLDLQTGSRQVLSRPLRASPVFATSSTIWYSGETLTPNQLPPSSPTGQLFSYNLATHQETRLSLSAEAGFELQAGA
ncbi:MAG: hypothetical protein M3Z28_09895 [Candidatus Dormibacteraeota bacterium]|nr:hypothetical protein [Candidatus Dormibacteraeota bacterium]